MTRTEKMVFMAIIPLLAAGIGAGATYLNGPEKEQIVVTGEAAKAAKDGKLTIEIIRKDETDSNWPLAFGVAAAVAAYAATMIAAARSR